MCAIAGFYRHSQQEAINIQALLEVQRHRGPDSVKCISEQEWSLGVARLNVTSPCEEETQPLWSFDRRYCFVFNGQVYNYKNLRSELEASGTAFTTRADGEVLFRGYLARGADFLLEAQGMFAGAIWDNFKKSWTLFRDPAGIKPLYFHQGSDFFVFSSEIKPLLQHSGRRLRRECVPEYLRNRYVSDGKTLFQGIDKVRPGHVMMVSSDFGKKSTPYFELNSVKNMDQPADLSQLAQTIQNSILETGSSDVGCTSLLSGGLDSSLVAQVMADHGILKKGFFFDNGYDAVEKQSAAWMAGHAGLLLETVPRLESGYELLPKILKSLEEPLGDSIILPTFQLMEAVGRESRVVVSGEGADELFAGYGHHSVFKRLGSLGGVIPKSLMASALEWMPLSVLNSIFPYPQKLSRQQFIRLGRKLQKFNISDFRKIYWLFDDVDLDLLFTEPVCDQQPTPSVQSLHELLRLDFESWLPDYNLLRMDKLSMHFSVEARLPFLNADVISQAFRLPDFQRINCFGKRKSALSRLAHESFGLPRRISNRKKHPFTMRAPDKESQNFEDFRQSFLSQSFREEFSFTESGLGHFFSEQGFLAEKQKTSLLNLAIWYDQFFKA